MIAIAGNNFISTKTISCFLQNKRHDKRSLSRPLVFAKNKDFPSKPTKKNNLAFPIKLSKSLLAKSVVAVFCLGFIDAGYSGDWSRIGVISKENEEFLKVAAFLVVPFCLFLVLSFIKENKLES
ncbi:hypothetical protein ACFE04_009442 [Oxalis oulophora]